MKKVCVILIITLLLFSCAFEIPQSVSAKTEGIFNFSFGKFTRDMSEYISVESIKENMKDFNSDNEYKIYDYNPKNSPLPSQKFLFDFPLQTIPLDMIQYFEKMDFSSEIKQLGFGPEIIDLNSFKTAEIAPIKVDLDFNRNVQNAAKFEAGTVSVPTNGGENVFSQDAIDSMVVPIRISSPEFNTMTFYEGRILVKTIPENVSDEGRNFSTSIKIGLFDSEESTEPISVADDVNFASTSRVFSFPLKGKTISNKVWIKVISGSSNGGEKNPIKYKLNSELNEIKIKEVTNLTLEEPIEVPVGGPGGSPVYINMGNSPKCTIAKGSLDVFAKKPASWDNWEGVTTVPEIWLKGGLVASPDDFEKDEREGAEYFLYRKKSLDNVVYRRDSGGIIVTGRVMSTVKNANIQLGQDDSDVLLVQPRCVIEELESICVDLRNDKLSEGFNQNTPLESSFTDFVKAFGVEEGGDYLSVFNIDIDYTNTLPNGNDIRLNVKTNFFEIDDYRVMAAGIENGEEKFESPIKEKSTEVLEDGSQPAIDFSVSWDIPGLGDDEEFPNCVLFRNLEVGKIYELKVTVNPSLNWDYIILKTEEASQGGASKTGLTFDNIFRGLTDAFGDEAVMRRLNFIEMPLYLYCVVPLKTTEDLDITGSIIIGNGKLDENSNPLWEKNDDNEDANIKILDENEKLETVKFLPPLVFDTSEENKDKEIVIESIADSEHKKDIAELFNMHTEGEIIFQHSLHFGGGEGLKVYKTDLDDEGDEEKEFGIDLVARLIVPFEFEVKNNRLDMPLAKLMDLSADDDLFHRDSATSIDEALKFIKAVEYVKIESKFEGDEGFIRYFNKNSKILDPTRTIFIEMNTRIPDIGRIRLNINGGDLFNLTRENFLDMLNKYPFAPAINAVLPVGCFYIAHGFEVGINMKMIVKCNGTPINIFGEED